MYEKELQEMIAAGLKAKEEILKIYDQKFDVEIKDDNSPVTEADKNADIIIRDHLSKIFPEYAFLTEESEDDSKRLNNEFVFIVDPVDGTKDFVARNDQFTTNIALAHNHEAVVGVIIIPAMNTIYYASKNNGAFKIENGITTKIHVNNKTENLTVLTSNFHLNKNELDVIEKHKDKITKKQGIGSSIKACWIAEGKAEISYRLSEGTKERDTAAFDIIVKEAGGKVIKPNGQPMCYNREDVYNREGYIILNDEKNLLL